MKYVVFVFLLAIITPAIGQVDEIKNASSSAGRSGGGRGGDSGGTSGATIDFVFNIVFAGIVEAQSAKLNRREEVPSMVSMDFIVQSAIQPSSYYIVNPRIRGNWGLFSTDFRLNYLIEEEFDGFKHIRTNEWQILQFNIITTKDVLFRIGGGFLQESFGGEHYYGEWTTALQVHPSKSKIGGMIEYRDAEERREFSAFARYHVIEHNSLHGFATAGMVYQKYYDTISVWGMQAGLIFSLY
jgi:hypothetical protein